uniref:IBR domain-containing protein n=1 Tax=Amphimedon queenslandica TaxID=400682 RepID=A0A1X7VCZ6_AMPQE
MPACGDLLCKDCFKAHFSIAIREKSVKHFNCPICGLPDLGNNDQMLEMNLQLLVAMVKVHLDSTDYDLCQKKLADFNLSKEPGFVRCTHEGCGAGFINDFRDRKKVECPECKRLMCFLCKKKYGAWADQRHRQCYNFQ